MYGYIYKTTNLINSKIYVGLKRSEVFIPTYLGSGGGYSKLGRTSGLIGAIRKYGRENFKVEVLEWCENEEALCNAELKWKKTLDVFNPAVGYNIYRGKEGPGLEKQKLLHWLDPDRYKQMYENRSKMLRKKYNGSCISEETRKKLIAFLKSRKRGRCSEETKRKISIANLGRIASNKGKPMSEEQKRKLSEVNKKTPSRGNLGHHMSNSSKLRLHNKKIGLHWWNDGTKQLQALNKPANNWIPGRLPYTRKPKFNNNKLV